MLTLKSIVLDAPLKQFTEIYMTKRLFYLHHTVLFHYKYVILVRGQTTIVAVFPMTSLAARNLEWIL